MYVIQVDKLATENSVSVMRRFTKQVRGSSILNQVRGRKYQQRAESPLRRKRRALKSLERGKEFERLKKLGKLTQTAKGGKK